MSAATAHRTNFAYKDAHTSGVAYTPADSTTIWNGTLVLQNASGKVVPLANTTDGYFVGYCIRPYVTVGTTPTDDVIVVDKGEILLNIASATDSNIGQLVYGIDDQTVSLTAVGTHVYVIGTIRRVPSSTTVVVDTANRVTRDSIS